MTDSVHDSTTNSGTNSGAVKGAVEMVRGHLPELATAADVSAISEHIDYLVIPAFKGDTGIEIAGGPGQALDKQYQVEMWKVLTAVGATGTEDEVTVIPGDVLAGSGIEADRILAVDLGSSEEITEETVRQAAGVASRKVKAPTTEDGDKRGAHVASTLGILGTEAALVGHALGAYRYSGAKAATPGVDKVTVLAQNAEDDAAKKAEIVAGSVAMARDLVNTPANVLYPESYAEFIRTEATAAGLDVEILDDKQLEEQGFGGIIGVGKGSARPPRLVRVSYTPADAGESTPFVALVGKGITFDTGGISLKPGANMWDMISDMGGSAAVVASIIAAAKLELNVRVTATVPLAENMPGSAATRPGDILRHYGGLTTEVLNTDAEGRLVLADAIVRACEDGPDYLIETATLTGAQMVALGLRTPGIMGSIDFRDRVSMLSQEVGEKGWPMPLPAELGEALKSDVADLRNISTTRWGGMSVAGHYLSNFVAEGVEWVHIDVAGPAYNTGSAHGYTPKRGTGVPVRTILAALEDVAAGNATNTGTERG